MSKILKKVTVLVPCYNEEAGIGSVIDGFPREELRKRGLELEVIVIDNNSKDDTAKVAAAHGALVVSELKKGKGNAIKTGFYSISDDTDFVVMLDGDDTYRPEEILRLIEPLQSNFCTVVVGSRLYGKMSEGSMKRFNLMANYLYTFLVRVLFGVNITDVLTGYYAWNRKAIVNLRSHLVSEGFAIEMEMMTKMAKLDEVIYSVPISYHSRAGESNLRPFVDGAKIMITLIKNLFWNPTEKQRYIDNVVAEQKIGVNSVGI